MTRTPEQERLIQEFTELSKQLRENRGDEVDVQCFWESYLAYSRMLPDSQMPCSACGEPVVVRIEKGEWFSVCCEKCRSPLMFPAYKKR